MAEQIEETSIQMENDYMWCSQSSDCDEGASCSNRVVPDLPSSILLDIFSYLPMMDLIMGVRYTCRHWSDLSYHSSLWRRINLADSGFKDYMFEALLQEVGEAVEELKIGDSNSISSAGIVHSNIFCPNLKKIDLSVSNFANARTVVSLAQKYPTLQGLDITLCSSIMLRNCLGAISSLSDLRFLAIEDFHEAVHDGSAWCSQLCKAIHHWQALQHFVFDCMINDEVIKTILTYCTKLQVLELKSWIDENDLLPSAFSCRSPNLTLHTLKLKGSGVMDAHLKVIADNFPNLQHLGIFSEAVTHVGINVLLSKCKHLQALGMESSERSLEHGPAVTLSNESPKSPCLGSTALKQLWVSWPSELNDSDILSLAQRSPHLTVLELNCCPVTARGVKSLADNCPHLRFLNINDSSTLTQQCLGYLLSRCRKLITLILDNVEADVNEMCATSELDLGDVLACDRTTFKTFMQGPLSCLSNITLLPPHHADLSGNVASVVDSWQEDKINLTEHTLLTAPSYCVVNCGETVSLSVTWLDKVCHALNCSSEEQDTYLSSNFFRLTELLCESCAQFQLEKKLDGANNSHTEVLDSLIGRKCCSLPCYCSRRMPVMDARAFHCHLTSLHLGPCSFLQDSDLQQIAFACPDLQNFSIRHCSSITDAGFITLFKCCPQLCNLTLESSLGFRGVTDKTILGAGQHGKSLRILSMPDSQFTMGAIITTLCAIPDLRVANVGVIPCCAAGELDQKELSEKVKQIFHRRIQYKTSVHPNFKIKFSQSGNLGNKFTFSVYF